MILRRSPRPSDTPRCSVAGRSGFVDLLMACLSPRPGTRTDDAEASDGEAGFVLLSVLLAALLFVAVAASFALRARILTLQTGNLSEMARAQAEIDGVALYAADALRPPKVAAPSEADLLAAALSGGKAQAAPLPPLPLPVDGIPLTCHRPQGGTLTVRAVDQGALIDLNGAPVPMLREFLQAAGLDSETARRLADEIGDFRDPDDAPQENGIGESAQYRQAGLAWGPANRPFVDVEEIARLPSATPALVARLRPLFTVANPRAGLDLSQTPGATAGLLTADVLKQPALARWQLASPRTDFMVEAALQRADGSVAAARRAFLRFEGPDGGALRIVRWLRPPYGDGAEGRAEPSDDAFCAGLATALPAATLVKR